jgi:Helicase conserved C-terminal domain
VTYTAWLRSLGPDGLAELLRLRPDAAARPAPTHLDELSARLTTAHSAAAALADVGEVALQLAEITVAYNGLSVDRLREWFGQSTALDDALSELGCRGLLWESGSKPHARTEPAGGVGASWPQPLNLGRGLRSLLGQLQANQLDLVTETLRVGRQSSRKKTHDVIATRLTADRIVALAAEAPPAVAKLLDIATWAGPNVFVDPETASALWWAGNNLRRSDVGWAVGHALLLPVAWDVLQMPREVGFALRGPDWRPALRTNRPAVATTAVDGGSVEHESAAAAAATLDAVASVMDTLGTSPATLLRSGGVGIREVRRLAKAARAEERTVVLALEVSRAAGLIAVSDGVVVPTHRYDHWRASPPGTQFVELIGAWWDLDGPVSQRSTTGDDRPEPALVRTFPRPDVQRLRRALLERASTFPAGTGVDTLPSLVADVCWDRPLAYPVTDIDVQAASCWWEAGAFGLVAHGAVTALGRTLLSGDRGPVLDAAHALMPTATAHATFQADLTAVVAGTPTAMLADLLDAAADRETRGSAHVWRFTPGSIRRFLDGGGQAEDLLADLAAVALQPVPQPLEYLIRDNSRRHGEVAVHPVGCCIVSADEPLLAEIAAHRSLRGLGVRILAPTVLASSKTVAETVETLRSTGYAPVRLTATGDVVVERDERRRKPRPSGSAGADVVDLVDRRPSGPTRRAVAESAPADPVALARTLLAQPDAAAPPRSESLTMRRLVDARTRLATYELRVLSHAVDHHEAVHIDYVDQNGGRTSRVISDISLMGGVIEAWCHLRQAERMFSLSGIESVSPAD